MLRRVLRGETLVPADEAFEILRARPHGHVAAVLGTLRKLGLAYRRPKAIDVYCPGSRGRRNSTVLKGVFCALDSTGQ